MEKKVDIITEFDKINIIGSVTPIPWGSLVTDFFTHYKQIKPIGHGVMGKIDCVCDLITGNQVVMKTIKKQYERVAEFEANILRKLDNPGIIKILNYFKSEDSCHLILEKMDCDLHSILQGKSRDKLDPYQQKFIFREILTGVEYLHNNGIIHRDIKSPNLLINLDCSIKICDFGYACEKSSKDEKFTTEIQTLSYRAPEVIMKSPTFSPAIDMWSLGCVLAEILGHKTGPEGKMMSKILFGGSQNEEQQLLKIIERLGKPTEETWPEAPKLPLYSRVLALPDSVHKSLSSFFEGIEVDPLALDLLSKFLTWNPEKRITATEALNHPYLKLS